MGWQHRLELSSGERGGALRSYGGPLSDLPPGNRGRGKRSRRDLEVLVRERTAELELAIEQMESADTIIDRWTLDGVIHYMNPFGLETFGFTAEEVVGNRAIGSIVPDDPARLAEWVAVREQLEADPNHNVHSEVQCVRKDGSPVWVAFRNRPILDADDNIVEVFSVGIDITDHREREANLQAKNERMEIELGIGRDIQRSLLPGPSYEPPGHPEFALHAALEAAREVSGDFYDYFPVGDRHLFVCIGDVSDKGVPAALYMAVTKTLLTSRAATEHSPAHILTQVNQDLCRRNEQSMFVTIFVAMLDTDTGELLYANAGHNPPLLRRRSGEVCRLDHVHGPAAGVLAGFEYDSGRLQLDPGEVVLMYTDGVTDAIDPDQVSFGDERLVALLRARDDGDTAKLVDGVFRAVADHMGSMERFDDAAIVALTCHGGDTDPDRLRVSFQGAIKEMTSVLDRFDRWMIEGDVPDDVRRDILLVADDLLSNVVSYAYEEGSHPVDIIIERASDRLVLTVSDEGRPFDPFSAPTPDASLPIDDRRPGGLGIHLIRSLTDEQEYHRRGGRNVVKVTKRVDTIKEARDEHQ